MDPAQSVRERIPDFPGYGDDLSRRRSDSFVRSYAGEALARAQERLGTLDAQASQRLDDLLLKLGFADARSFPAHNGLAETESRPPDERSVAERDAALLDLADRASAVDTASFGAYLDEVAAALDRREATMRALASGHAP